ncbi:MAG: hypothetical protein K2G84_05915, partial [Muribaculaceae bacterium]|nr:hypothetical protein [Muribaculaceae bacterium]
VIGPPATRTAPSAHQSLSQVTEAIPLTSRLRRMFSSHTSLRFHASTKALRITFPLPSAKRPAAARMLPCQ